MFDPVPPTNLHAFNSPLHAFTPLKLYFGLAAAGATCQTYPEHQKDESWLESSINQVTLPPHAQPHATSRSHDVGQVFFSLLCAVVWGQVCVPLPPWAVRAGARENIYYNPSEVHAAIVTCGGLCPGLNDVVLGLVNKLSDYGVPEGNIMGIRFWLYSWAQPAGSSASRPSFVNCVSCRGPCRWPMLICAFCSHRYGFKGFYDKKDKPIVLTRKNVEGIQLQGGTILGTSRGGADIRHASRLDSIRPDNLKATHRPVSYTQSVPPLYFVCPTSPEPMPVAFCRPCL